MTLSERARSRRVAGARRSDAELDRQRGAKRLAKWKAQPPFDFGTLFQQRLEQSGLTEADLLELLSEWAGAVRDGASQAPWATELAEALTDGSAGEAGTYATDPGRRKLIDLRSPALSSIRRRRAYAGQEGGERDEPHATEKGDGDPPAAGFGGAGKDAVVPQLRWRAANQPKG